MTVYIEADQCQNESQRRTNKKQHSPGKEQKLYHTFMTLKMEQFQVLRVFLLCLLALHQCPAIPLGSQCVDESFCTYSLQDYYSQLVNMPSHINERSIATWSYVENIDLNRVPQVIHEASCHTSHSCRGLDNTFGLETIPVSLRMPVLRKNPTCFPAASYSLEFELITIACICAISRHS